MKVKRKAYWWLLVLTIIFTLSIISTLIPAENANKVCLLGYKAHCSFTPISTIICAVLAALTCIIRKRFFVVYK